MNERQRQRRRILAAFAAAPVVTWSGPLAATERLPPTPADAEGPFYPLEFPADSDNDLMRFVGREAAPGRLAHLQGRVSDPDGTPIDGARVEIWQCDPGGVYHHPGDPGDKDARFQGFGAMVTDRQGGYHFRALRPVPYAGRTPHIHYRVTAPGFERLTTQLYVAEEGERNAADGLYNRHSPEERALLTRAFRPLAGHDGPVAATFNIVLG